MSVLRLAVKREYFEAIKSGEKTEEFRLCNDYWKNRLSSKNFSSVVITNGYPKSEDTERTLVFPWVGFEVKAIKHNHFGENEVEVFAIKLVNDGKF